MSQRQKQHMGRSAGDDRELDGRDRNLDEGTGRIGSEEAAADGRHIGDLVDENRRETKGRSERAGEQQSRDSAETDEE